jgi:tetratricopeptide (TPR) repeat protein
LAAAAAFVLRPADSFSRHKIEFQPASKIDSSLAAAQDRLRVDPQDLAALVDLGSLQFQKGKEFYPDAINALEEARDLGALDPRIFYCLGIMYQEVGLYPFALDEYKRYLRHYPNDRDIRMLEAKLLYKQGRYLEAVSEYERLKYRYPKDGLIEENLGLSLWGAKAVDRAAESFNLLKSSKDENQAKRAEFYLGEIALAQDQAQAALDHFLACRPQAASPSFGVAPYQVDAALAAAYEKLGRSDEAKASWQKVLTESPDDAASKQAKAALRGHPRRSAKKRRR